MEAMELLTAEETAKQLGVSKSVLLQTELDISP